jgi:hypothetical protein
MWEIRDQQRVIEELEGVVRGRGGGGCQVEGGSGESAGTI